MSTPVFLYVLSYFASFSQGVSIYTVEVITRIKNC